MYPEVIEAALTVLNNLGKHYDLTDFIKKTEICRFIQEVLDLLGEKDPRVEKFQVISQALASN
jgi:hypothetical protein